MPRIPVSPKDQSFSGFHIHDGAAVSTDPSESIPASQGGANAVPVNPAGGVLHYEVEVPVDNADCREYSCRDLPKSCRTTTSISIRLTNPGGVIRAQLRSTDQYAVSRSNMTTANEVPPITGVDASAPAVFTAHTIRKADGSVARRRCNLRRQLSLPRRRRPSPDSTSITASATENGPVTINTGFERRRITSPQRHRRREHLSYRRRHQRRGSGYIEFTRSQPRGALYQSAHHHASEWRRALAARACQHRAADGYRGHLGRQRSRRCGRSLPAD